MSPVVSGGSGGGSGIPAGGSSGQVVGFQSAGVGQWVNPPGFEISYTQITANVTVASGTEASGTAVISPGAATFDGAPVICTFYSPSVLTATADLIIVSLFEGATQLARLADIRGGVGVVAEAECLAEYRFTPSAGSHTYSITAIRGTSSGTIIAGAGGTGAYAPAFVRFTKV